MLRIHYQILLILSLFSPLIAQGGPPLLTDDPGTPEAGHYEINTAITAEFHKNEREFEAPLIDMNYGIAEREQIKLEIPLAIDHDGNTTRSGLGDVTLGWKRRFLEQSHAFADVSFYPQLSFGPSSRSKRLGFSDSGVALLIPFQMSHDFGRFSLTAEIGHAFRTQNADESLFGIAYSWKASDRTEWLAEYHQIFSNDAEERERLVNVGFRQEVSSHVHMLTSVGTSPNTADADRTKLAVYLGLQFTD